MTRQSRRGLSLLEVILSIAILGVALATIGQLIRIGARNAVMARDLATAQMYCDSTLNEVSCGAIEPTTGSGTLDDLGDWTYELTVEPTEQQNMLSLKVVVTQDPAQYSRPVSFTMTRWMIDPVFAEEAAAKEAEMKALFAEAQKAATSTQSTATGGLASEVPAISGQVVDPNAIGGMLGQGGAGGAGGQQGGRGQKGRGQQGNGNQGGGNQGDKGGKTGFGGKGPGNQNNNQGNNQGGNRQFGGNQGNNNQGNQGNQGNNQGNRNFNQGNQGNNQGNFNQGNFNQNQGQRPGNGR